jgi:Tfp pilus assembly ATPase PilU
MSDTLQFTLIPFTYQGVNFISRISQDSRFYAQIMSMGQAFIDMNIAAINDCIPDLASLSIDELNKQIAYINDGGTEMFLELAGN